MEGSLLRAVTVQLDGETDITAWNGRALATYEQDSSYGLAVGPAERGGSVAPPAVLGFPDAANTQAKAPPFETLALVRRDIIGRFLGLGRCPWKTTSVGSRDLSHAPVLVGGKSCNSQAGSSTGYSRSADESR